MAAPAATNNAPMPFFAAAAVGTGTGSAGPVGTLVGSPGGGTGTTPPMDVSGGGWMTVGSPGGGTGTPPVGWGGGGGGGGAPPVDSGGGIGGGTTVVGGGRRVVTVQGQFVMVRVVSVVAV